MTETKMQPLKMVSNLSTNMHAANDEMTNKFTENISDITDTSNVTVEDLCNYFMEMYGLTYRGLNTMKHEAIHAATGFSISITDEERIAVYDHVLYDNTSATGAMTHIDVLHKDLVSAVKGDWMINAKQSSLTQSEFNQIQSQAEKISNEEVKEHWKLAQKLKMRLYDIFGEERLHKINEEDVLDLRFSDIDFVEQAQAIKAKFQTEHDKMLEDKTAKAFANAAEAKGKTRYKNFPAPSSPWHGAGFKLFRP